MSKVSMEKYENVILYLCNSLGGIIRGKKKLAKLLYYVDFDHYEYKESCKSITGDEYQRKQMGPVPLKFEEVLDSLKNKGKIKISEEENKLPYRPTEVYECLAEVSATIFDSDEKFILDRVVRIYGELSGKQLENLTHDEAPYIGTDGGENIMYGLAFYRETDFGKMAA